MMLFCVNNFLKALSFSKNGHSKFSVSAKKSRALDLLKFRNDSLIKNFFCTVKFKHLQKKL